MLKKNLALIAKALNKAHPKDTLSSIYKKSGLSLISYRTFYRGVKELRDQGLLSFKKVSNGRGKGAGHVLESIDHEGVRSKSEIPVS